MDYDTVMSYFRSSTLRSMQQWFADRTLELTPADHQSSLIRYVTRYGVEHCVSSNQHVQAHQHLQNLHFLTHFVCAQEHERVLQVLRALKMIPSDIRVSELVWWTGLEQQYSCLLDFLLFVNWYETFEDVLNHLEGMHLFEDDQHTLEHYRVELFRENGQYEEAIEIVLRKVDHLTDRPLADVHVHLGVLYLFLHQLEQSEHHLLAAFDLFSHIDTVLDEDDMGNIHHNLGALRRKQADFEVAHHHYTKAIEHRTEEFGEDDYRTLNSMQGLALVEKQMGNVEYAISTYQSLIRQYQHIFGSLHIKTLTVMNNLSIVVRDNGDLEEARQLQQDVVENSIQLLGSEHPFVWTAQMNLATIYKRQERIIEAISCYRDVLKLQREHLGFDNLDCLTTEYKLATTLTYLDQPPNTEIESLLRHVYQERQRQLGSIHPVTFVAGGTLGDFWEMHDEWMKRGPHLEALLLAEQERSGTTHPKTVSRHYQLAKNHLKMKNGSDAVAHLNVVIEQHSVQLGDMHADLAMPYWNMARAYRMLGQPAKAAEYRKRCYDIEILQTTELDEDVLYTMLVWLKDLQKAGQVQTARSIVQSVFEMANVSNVTEEQQKYLDKIRLCFQN